jgi:hypothetical protein
MSNTDHLDPTYVARVLALYDAIAPNLEEPPLYNKHSDERLRALLNTARSDIGNDGMEAITALRSIIRLQLKFESEGNISPLPEWFLQEAFDVFSIHSALIAKARTQPPP